MTVEEFRRLMLRAILICPDQELGNSLEEKLLEIGQVGIARRLDRYPTNLEMVRLIRALAPHVVFLSIESMSKAFDVLGAIEANAPGIQMVAVHRMCDPQILLELMRAGIREFVSLPFRPQNLLETIARVADMVGKKPPSIESTDLLFAFLPSKAGVGTSTLAVNTAVALSRMPDTNVLLMDMDLNCGLVRFMLKLDNPYSLVDACQNANQIDESLWPRMVTSVGSMDVMHAGKLNPEARIESAQVRHLLEYSRRNYKAICVDLSGNLEKFSIELMQEARRIFLVCTPEIPSLHLAREKYAFLKNVDLSDRVSILLNRVHKRAAISSAQIEELLGVPVMLTFPNDYQGVHKALSAGCPVESNTDMGKQLVQLAKTLLDRNVQTAEPKKRLVEYFSILPARYTMLPEGKKSAV